jgi:hypothetical protein
MDASALRLHQTPRKNAHIREMNFDELKEKGLFVPPVEKKFLQLPKRAICSPGRKKIFTASRADPSRQSAGHYASDQLLKSPA